MQLYSNINGILICFVIIKFLNYIEKFNSGVGMLFEVIAVAQHDLVYFFVIILVIFLTFICTFQVAFGANHLAFSTQMKCFLSLWTFTLRDHEKLD